MSLQRQAWQAHAFAWASGLVQCLQRATQALTPPPFRLMQFGSAFWQSRALYVATQLDLASVLGDGRLLPAELAQRVGADAEALARLVRLLAAIGIFEVDRQGRIGNNRASQPLRGDHPQCVRHMVLMHNSPGMSRPWFETLEAGVRQGRVPFELCHGHDLLTQLNQQPDQDALFAQAMDEVEALGGDSFATAFNWRAFDRLIDVGGNRGAKAATILRRHPHLQALVVDRAQVVAQAQAAGGHQGLQFEVGDVLAGPLPAARSDRDAYLLSAVLHGFDDDSCVQALGRVRQAVGQSGASIVLLELIVPEHNADLASANFDVQMYMATRGRERTRTQWQALIERSGLRWTETVALASLGSMLVLRSPH
jgi:hypothetical protein